MSYSRDKNPFYTEEDDDDFGFEKSRSTYSSKKDPFSEDYDTDNRPLTRYEMLQRQKQASMARQLQSTERAMASIYDSEQMGIATAEELVQQGEQLDNTENKLDKINVDMKTSQRHLNGIKSVFGSFKNWLSGKDKREDTTPVAPKEKEPTKLQQTLENAPKSSRPHPAYRLRADDVSGFYADDNLDELDNKFLSSGSASRSQSGQGYGGAASRGASGQGYGGATAGREEYQSRPRPAGQKQAVSSGLKEYDEQFEKNIELMSSGITGLKGLAMGLGDEIERQNEQLDRIDTKVDKADVRLRDQNRQMRQILGK